MFSEFYRTIQFLDQWALLVPWSSSAGSFFSSVVHLQLESVPDIDIIFHCILGICFTWFLGGSNGKNMLGTLREMASFKALQRLLLLSDVCPMLKEQVDKWYMQHNKSGLSICSKISEQANNINKKTGLTANFLWVLGADFEECRKFHYL